MAAKQATVEAVEPLPVSQRRAWAVTAMIVVLMVINFGDKAVLGLAAKPIMVELGLNATQFGAISSSFYFLFSLSALVVGFLSSRVSTTKILGVITVLWSIAALPVLLLATVPMLYLSRISLGAAEGPTAPIAAHAVQKWFPEGRRTIPTALTTMGGGLGLAITAPTLTYFITNHGWRSAFVVLALIGIGWAIAWRFVGREGPYSTYAAGRAGGMSATNEEPRLRYSQLFVNRTWLGCLACGVGAYWALATATAWLPSLLEGGRGYSAQTASMLVSLPHVVSIIAILGAPIISDLLRARGVSIRVAQAGLAAMLVVIAGAAALAIPLSSGSLTVVLICAAFGLGGAFFPLSFVMGSHIAPVAQRGAAMSAATAVVTMTGVVAPMVVGRVIDSAGGLAAGFDYVFLVSGLVTLIAGLVGLVVIHPDADARRLGLRD